MIDQQGLGWRGILPGDVVYIYTGWGDGWHDPDQEKVYYTKGPGLSIDAAEYLASRSIVLVALDNPFTDPVADGQLARQHAPPQGMGESWHNNHHAFPASARHGLYPGQIDIGYQFIVLLERFGLACNVQTPDLLPMRPGISPVSEDALQGIVPRDARRSVGA